MTSFDHLFHFLKKPWVIISYIILVCLAYYFVDKPSALYFHHLKDYYPIWPLKLISLFGKWSLVCIFFAMLGLFFRFVTKEKVFEQRAWYLLACVGFSNLIVSVLKIIVSRARPELLFEQNLFGFYWFKMNDLYWSFPSGHSITAGALAAGLSILFPRYFYLFLSAALLIIATRILLGFHYVSDVMTGFYLSILFVGFFTQKLKKYDAMIFNTKD